jgi:phosphatidate cytidylyltransferase
VAGDLSGPRDAAPPGLKRGRGELWLRVASASVLAPVALGVAYWGGFPFAAFWTIAALGVLWEWGSFVSAKLAGRLLIVGAVALAAAVLAVIFERPQDIVLAAAVALVIAGVIGRGAWGPVGLAYAGSIAVAPIVLRADPAWGLTAVALLFAVVWGTDIAAYFGGRLLGGPKLWPQVSPKKTWSGALVGTSVAAAGGTAVAWAADVANLAAVAVLCIALSAASQLGDLLESAIKRRFGAKDAGHLIPGHGGLMDRLDGFVIAAALAAIVGVARGGFEAPSRGLLIW